MQNARVFLVEDDPLYREFASENLRKAGHEVVLEAANLEEAKGVIRSGQLQEKRVDIAVVDGFLPTANRGKEIFAGPIVAETIRENNPSIKIVSHSSLPANMMGVTYGDTHAWKRDENALEAAIASL